MTTVLVVPEGSRVVLREEWELEGRNAPHVDHVTDDLTGFLRTISAKPA
jgi:putative hydrolase of the HAD superfamily